MVGVGAAWRFAHRGPGAIAGFHEQWEAVASGPPAPAPQPVAFASFAFSSGVSVALVPLSPIPISEPTRPRLISYAVFSLKKKNTFLYVCYL